MPKDNQLSDSELIAVANLKTIKAIKELEPLLNAIAVAQLKSTEKLVKALSGKEALVIKPVLEQISSLKKLVQRKDKTTEIVMEANKRIISEIKDISVDIDLDPFIDSIKGLEGILKKLPKGLPLEKKRVAVKLYEEDIKRLEKAMNWRVTGPFDVRAINKLVPEQHDDVIMTYDVNNNMTRAEFKMGLNTVAIIEMTYDVNNNMTRVYRV